MKKQILIITTVMQVCITYHDGMYAWITFLERHKCLIYHWLWRHCCLSVYAPCVSSI